MSSRRSAASTDCNADEAVPPRGRVEVIDDAEGPEIIDDGALPNGSPGAEDTVSKKKKRARCNLEIIDDSAEPHAISIVDVERYTMKSKSTAPSVPFGSADYNAFGPRDEDSIVAPARELIEADDDCRAPKTRGRSSNQRRTLDRLYQASRRQVRSNNVHNAETEEPAVVVPVATLVVEDKDNPMVVSGHAEPLLPWWKQGHTRVMFACFCTVLTALAISVAVWSTKDPENTLSSSPSLSRVPPGSSPPLPTAGHSSAPSPAISSTPSTASQYPTQMPSLSGLPTASLIPSAENTVSVTRTCSQVLHVENAEEFTDVQVSIFEFLMQSYTADFGFMVGEPVISTKCEVTGQYLGAGLDDDLTETSVVIIDFTMQFESKFGYDLDDYPREFSSYINNNLDAVSSDMAKRFLPVIEADSLVVYNTEHPTFAPTLTASPTHRPTTTTSPSLSGAPSVSTRPSSRTVRSEFQQVLVVYDVFTDIQFGIYELLMESYTADFGFKVAEPYIETQCEMTAQNLATSQDDILLIITFTMQYESSNGYDVSDYPHQYASYINSNLEKISEDMAQRFLPVAEAMEVILCDPHNETPCMI